MVVYYSKVFIFTLVCALLYENIHSHSDEDVEIDITRTCKIITECEFYTDLIKLQKTQILGLEQELVNDELKNQNCGWEKDIEPKGKILVIARSIATYNI